MTQAADSYLTVCSRSDISLLSEDALCSRLHLTRHVTVVSCDYSRMIASAVCDRVIALLCVCDCVAQAACIRCAETQSEDVMLGPRDPQVAA